MPTVSTAGADVPPKFSVIVPTRDRPEYLAESIASILAQSVTDFEIIVVDDCGDLPAVPPDDPRIRTLRLDRRHGPAGARNAGVAAARGDAVTFLDDDDWWTPDRLRIAAEGLRHAPVALCFSRWEDEPAERGRRRLLRGWIGDQVMHPRWTPSLHTIALRRECWLGLDDRYLGAEDTEFALRLFNEFHVWTVPEFGYVVRRHAGVRDLHGADARVQGMRLMLTENADWFERHRYAKAFRTRRIGLTYSAAGDRDDAARTFVDSLRILPTPGAARDLARVLLRKGRPDAPYRGKRLLDLVILAAVAPPALALGSVCALAVRLTSPGPVIFRQVRVGMNGAPFEVRKFRTMIAGDNPIYPDASRITSAGRVLRRLSLDELPQLINVARGEMSIVGPRPTLAYQVERYDDRQRRRLAVRPGLTGLAQVSGRNALAWADRIEFDVRYVEEQSPRHDLQIIARTAATMLSGKGVEGHPTDDPLAAPPGALAATDDHRK